MSSILPIAFNSGSTVPQTTQLGNLAIGVGAQDYGGLNFTTAGQTDTWIIMDTGNNIAWRISLIVGAAYNNNMVSIERLV